MLKNKLSSVFNLFLDLTVNTIFPIIKKQLKGELEKDFRSFGVEDTNVCNARCSFCAYRLDYDKRPKGFVDEKVLKHSLELFKKLGSNNIFSFISILGDPLTDKDILKKMRLITSDPSIKGASIYTNLIGLDEYDIDEFVQSGVTVLNVSTCLGGKEMYKRLFGVDEYDRVMNNIVNLLEANKRHGNPIKTTLLIRMDYPVEKHLDSQVLNKINSFIGKDKLDILPNNMWDDYNDKIKIGDLPRGGVFKNNYADKRIPCYALYRKMQILLNGDIAVCSCRVSPDLVTDNIFNYQNLNDYWHGDKLKIFRQNWIDGKVPGICKGCNHYLPVTGLEKKILKRRIKDRIRKIMFRR